MRLATKKALLASIDKWKQYETAPNLSQIVLGRKTCPLCIRFGFDCERNYSKTSERCPVYKFTGFDSCEFTPFDDACDAHNDERLVAFRAAARREREFLESLLPSPTK